MKTQARLVPYVLVAVMLLSIMVVPNVGPFNADVVSAATGSTTAPAPSKAPSKAPTPAQTTNNITSVLKIGAKGHEVKLLQIWLNSNGCKLKVDGIFGKATLVAVKDYQKKNGFKVDGVVGVQLAAKLNPANAKVTVKLGRAQFAAHGTKCFTDTVVAMAGDKIVAASIDDFQFMAKDTSVAVPNSDKDFGLNYKDPAKVLASKRANAAAYSANMAKSGGATQTIDKNLDAIQAYAAGKTIADIEKTLGSTAKEKMVDVVSGATLADTYGYTQAIVAAAKAAK